MKHLSHIDIHFGEIPHVIHIFPTIAIQTNIIDTPIRCCDNDGQNETGWAGSNALYSMHSDQLHSLNINQFIVRDLRSSNDRIEVVHTRGKWNGKTHEHRFPTAFRSLTVPMACTPFSFSITLISLHRTLLNALIHVRD